MFKFNRKKAGKTDISAAEKTSFHFEYGGKKYNVTGAAIIPTENGNQKMTAADICAETSVHEYLVKNKCSCIQEVIE